MSSWILVPCLAALRTEFNEVAPDRDRGADGAIGDSSHTSSSDHTPDEDSDVLRDHDADSKNEVHALDIDSSGPWPAGRTFKSIVLDVIAGEKAKWLDPDDKCRLNYVIFDREIYDKDNDFEPRDYTGSDPHTNHAHFSGRYETSCENDTRPWGVDDMSWTDDVITNPTWRADSKTNPTVQAKFALYDAWNRVHNVEVALAAVAAQLKTLTGKDLVDEQAIAASVLAGLSPEQIAAALPAELAEAVAQRLAERLAA